MTIDLTEADYTRLLENPFFKNALEVSIIEWNSAHSVEQRIKLRSAAALEDALPTLAARMTKQDEPLTSAIETGKLFAKLAQIGEDRRGGLPGEQFKIVINLGADKKLDI